MRKALGVLVAVALVLPAEGVAAAPGGADGRDEM